MLEPNRPWQKPGHAILASMGISRVTVVDNPLTACSGVRYSQMYPVPQVATDADRKATELALTGNCPRRI
jgi:hypothetical protein